MGRYSGDIGRPDRARAIAAVVAVHAALAAIILSGLNVPTTIRRAAEQLTTIDIAEPPPPRRRPPPARKSERAKAAEGAAARQAQPTEIVAPPPRLQPPSPIVAAPIAASGAAPSSGAALAGSGTGAGGTGIGPGGGGGGGDTSRFTPARLVRNLRRGDYRVIATGRLDAGSADVTLSIAANGAVSGCRLIRSSGDAVIDRGLCPLLAQRLRFKPALDDRGRPIPYRTNYHASWKLGP